MVHSSTLKMGSVHVTLPHRYALLDYTVSPEHHYHFSISHIDSASLTDTSLFLHVAIYGASNPLLLNLCYIVLCTLSAGLLNAMKRIKLTLVQFCFVYYGKREQIRISWTVLLKHLFYDHSTFMFLCDALSSNMQRNLEKSRCWGFFESLSAGNDTVLSLKKNGEIRVSSGMKQACLYCTWQMVSV